MDLLTMVNALSTGIIVVLFSMVMLIGVIFPIIILIKCAMSARSGTSKALWIIAMVLTSPFGPYIYAILYGKTRFRRIVSMAILLLCIGVVIIGVYMKLEPSSADHPRTETQPPSSLNDANEMERKIMFKFIASAIKNLENSATQASPEDNNVIQSVILDLYTLEDEIKASGAGTFDLQAVHNLTTKATSTLSVSAFHEWQTAFAARKNAVVTPAPQ